MPVSDRGTLEDVSQSPRSSFKRCCKLLILNGEMLERSIRHAWKLIPLPRADAHQNPPTQSPSTTSRNNDARERVPVSRGICRGFRGVCDTVLTQNAVPVSEIPADAHRYALLCDVQELRRWSPEPLHVQNHGNISVAVKQVEPSRARAHGFQNAVHAPGRRRPLTVVYGELPTRLPRLQVARSHSAHSGDWARRAVEREVAGPRTRGPPSLSRRGAVDPARL
jgi:hypothetical protein